MAGLMNKTLISALGLSVGLLASATAAAWYGGYYGYRPPGSGAMTYERQTLMRRHGDAMDDLGSMIHGRRVFDRDEAVRLARDLEQGFSGQLLRATAPGAVVAGSRMAPRAWHQYGAFEGYNEAARQSAARLADALAEPPTDQGRWVPGGPPQRGPLAMTRDRAISLEAVQEFGRLQATCYSCHMLFRGPRW
jgi:cytochrome c556